MERYTNALYAAANDILSTRTLLFSTARFLLSIEIDNGLFLEGSAVL